MREIKFRAWDKDKEVLRQVLNLHGDLDFESITEVDVKKVEFETLPDNGWQDRIELLSFNFILMQYTGKKDKNGLEIYEGDIVRHFMNEINAVVFDDGMFTYRIKDEFGTRHSDGLGDTHMYAEVIGNIYENPELLEELPHDN